MDSARYQFERVSAGAVTCACVECGAREGFDTTGAAGRAGWRSVGGNQSMLLCPSCSPPDAANNRRHRRTLDALARSKRPAAARRY